jgi:hypothetical protein
MSYIKGETMKPLPLALFFVLAFTVLLAVQNFSTSSQSDSKELRKDATYEVDLGFQVSNIEIEESGNFVRSGLEINY